MSSSCTIGILSYNAREQVVRAVRSVRQYAAAYPLVVWDNRSTDGSAEAVSSLMGEGRLVAGSRNLGFSGGSNALVQTCHTPYVLLMNADVCLEEPDTVERLVSYMNQHSDTIAVSPSIRDGTQLRHQAHRSITPQLCIVRDSFVGRLLRGSKWYRRANYQDKMPRAVFDAQKITNCCCMVRREKFLELGGFDERLILYWTEEEFGLKAQRRGYSQAVFGPCTVTHRHGASTASLNRSLLRGIYVRDRFVYMRSNFGLTAALLVEGLLALRPSFWGALYDYAGYLANRKAIAELSADVTQWRRSAECDPSPPSSRPS